MDDETRACFGTLQGWIDALRSAEGFYPGAEGFRIGSTRLLEKLVSHAEHDDEYHLYQRDEDGTESDLTGARSIQGIPISETDPTTTQILGYNATTNEWTPTAAGAAAAHEATHRSGGADELSHDNLAGVSADDHHNESHAVASHNDTTATGTELETLTDGSDADALHDHATLATAAEAIAAVEGEATLDLTGDVTIAAAKSLGVDTIGEKTGAAGVTIDLLTLIKDGKITPHSTYPNAFFQATAGGVTIGFDANDYFLFAIGTSTWSLYLGGLRFKIAPAQGDFYVPLEMNSNKILGLTAGSASGEAVEYDQLHAQAHTVASHSDTTATGAETETLTDGSDATSLHVHKKTVIFKVLAHDTALTTGDNKEEWTVPLALNGWNLTDADAAVYTASTSGAVGPIQIYNLTQTADMLSTGITLDVNEKNSYTAATPPVIDTNNDDVATGDVLRFDVDTTAGTGTKGLDVIMVFTKP